MGSDNVGGAKEPSNPEPNVAGQRQPLSRHLIISTAIAMADRDGVATLTLAGAATLEATDWTFKGPVHFLDAVTGAKTAVFQQDVTGQGTSLHTHKHSGVETGSGQTGQPS